MGSKRFLTGPPINDKGVTPLLRGLYTAASGLVANQKRNDVVANNLANINTAGFKKEGTVAKTFNEVLIEKIDYTKANSPGITTGYLGKGVQIDQIITDHSQGALLNTGGPLDIAIAGPGYLVVQDEDGQEFYTRDGSLTLNSQGQLTTQSGHLVLSNNGPIQINGNNIEISEIGQVVVDGTAIANLQLVDIQDPKKYGHNLFTGENPVELAGKVQQGFLEGSNVNAVEEMVKMITLMRNYETNQKVIQSYDNTLDKLNEIGRF